MPDGQLWLEPQRVLDGARGLAASGENLSSQRAGAGNELAASSAGRPWGKDQVGAAFEKEYRPMEQKVLQAWEQIAAYVEGLGQAAAQSAYENVQTDDAAGVRVDQDWKNS